MNGLVVRLIGGRLIVRLRAGQLVRRCSQDETGRLLAALEMIRQQPDLDWHQVEGSELQVRGTLVGEPWDTLLVSLRDGSVPDICLTKEELILLQRQFSQLQGL